MTVEIYEANDSYEEYEQVATFERGEWIEGGDHVDPEGFYDDQSEGLVLRDFDGPSLVAIDGDNATEPAEAHDPDAHEAVDPEQVDKADERASQASLTDFGAEDE